MIKLLKMRLIPLFLTTIVLSLTLASCDEEPIGDRPELPPVETMLMDFSDFSEAPSQSKGTDATWANFTYSYLTVGFWNLAATLYSALPVAAYGYALQQDAVYLGDFTWEWAFDFQHAGISYTATLTGARISNQEFSMEMVIALAATPDTGVKWFDGTVRYDHTHAVWTIYSDGMEALQIEWNKDYETTEADLTYTVVLEGDDEFGSFIQWDYDPGHDLDAAYNIAIAEGSTNIQWNTMDLNGRVKSMNHFADEDWHCWDTQANGLVDMDCQ
jgi:hypothetical protein